MTELNSNFREVEARLKKQASRSGIDKEAGVGEILGGALKGGGAVLRGALKMGFLSAVAVLAGLPLITGYGTGYTASAFTSPTRRDKERLKDEMKQLQMARVRKSMEGRKRRAEETEKHRKSYMKEDEEDERYPKGQDREIRL